MESERSNEPNSGESRSTVVGHHQQDGRIEIVFEENDLRAVAEFHPPSGDGQHITPEYAATVLEKLNIVYGVDWDALREHALECNLNNKVVGGVVAVGDAPEEAVGEYFEVDPSFRKWPVIPEGDLPRIDFRELSPFVVVKQGQVLALRRDAKEGKDGKNVHGEIVPRTMRKPPSAQSGPNTRLDGDALRASCHGRLMEADSVLAVSEVLEVKGGVGYGTGHIVFPGDVVIENGVAEGFKVYAGGSVLSKQTLDATDVITKKDLIVAGGLVGKGKASVRVGGSLRAKFIQNCRVAARDSVIVAAAVINCRIYTMQSLDLGDKGRLIGGEVFAIKGVRAAGIGGEKAVSTKIHCGVDFTVQQELDRVNDHLRVLSMKLNRLKEMPPEELERIPTHTEFEAKAREEMARLSIRASELLGKLDSDENASVTVTGEIAAGTLIEICHVALFVDQSYRKVRFRLDKAHGRLIHEPL